MVGSSMPAICQCHLVYKDVLRISVAGKDIVKPQGLTGEIAVEQLCLGSDCQRTQQEEYGYVFQHGCQYKKSVSFLPMAVGLNMTAL